ncbi:MAG: anthranilate synthase component I family protein [Phycisphaerales bacterium]|nr:anthranilate synthase component I family protein [Phycisphaerales bacterium]
MRPRAPHPDWPGREILALAAHWPATEPLAILHSGSDAGAWSRLSLLARPRGHLRLTSQGTTWTGPRWPELEDQLAAIDTRDPLAVIDAAAAAGRAMAPTAAAANGPFPGGWLMSLRYELGGHLEPTARSSRQTPDTPLADLLWCPDALAHDAADDQWWEIGDLPGFVTDRSPRDPFQLGEWNSQPAREQFEAAVAQTVNLIRRGDLFQANIARQLSATCTGDLRRFAIDALQNSEAWFGGWLEFPGAPDDRAVLSLSPELFLDLDGDSGRIRSRPIKGTRPARDRAEDLAHSEKDTAELNMIVDLVRNDLGRVCRLGSVHVSQPRAIESHPTVHHGVAEVSGQLPPGTGIGDVIRASFPPGSVTGAPKIRAMQVIDELEPFTRGPYCGAMGYLTSTGHLRLGVSIRTAAFEGRADAGFESVSGQLRYGTGCGIVVDSIPAEEYEESQHKAAALMNAARAAVTQPVP